MFKYILNYFKLQIKNKRELNIKTNKQCQKSTLNTNIKF